MAKWAVEAVIKYGKDVKAAPGSVGKEIESLGKVILLAHGPMIVSVWPYGSHAADGVEDWLVKVLVKLLTSQ